mgnify:CR=1 FL=1
MIKYDFQKPSKIPLLEQAGTPTLLRLKKRRFQCKSCRRVTVAETSIVEKNCQISNLVRQKVTQLLTEKVSLTDIARRLRVSMSTVYRKLDQFTFKEHYDKLPAIMSWDEFGFKKGKLAFVAQNYETNKLITILDNRCQTTYTKLLFEVSIESPTTGTVYHDGYVWSLYSTGSQALSKRQNRS